MIFVTVGTHTAPFDRLICAMDEVAATTDEPVIMQIGCATSEPRHAAWFRFAPYGEMQRYNEEARVVVCQGATSVLVAMHAGAAVVAVPRRRAFGEHIDDHQVEFVARMAERGLVTAVNDVGELKAVTTHAGLARQYEATKTINGLCSSVQRWVEEATWASL